MGPSTFMRGSLSMHGGMHGTIYVHARSPVHACMYGTLHRRSSDAVLMGGGLPGEATVRSYADGQPRSVAAAGIMGMGKLMHTWPCTFPVTR